MGENSKVSVVLPCYNHARYVAAAIESVLSQSYSNLELFVFDNGSEDQSWEIISRFHDPRLEKIRLAKNDMLEVKRRFIEMATGEYFAIQYSDDLWEKEKLEKQMALFAANPDAKICFTWGRKVEVDEELRGHVKDGEEDFWVEKNKSQKEWWEAFMTRANHLLCSSSVFQRDLYIRHFGRLYPSRQIADWLCWMKILQETNIYIVEDFLTVQQMHDSGDNRNESYLTPDVVRRQNMEIKYVLYKVIDEMPDDVFARNFCGDLAGNAYTHLDIMCRKMLFLAERKDGFYSEYENAVRYYFTYFDYEEDGVCFYQYLDREYGFSRNDFFAYEAGDTGLINKLLDRLERWKLLEGTDFQKLRYPEEISIYGCGDIGKALYRRVKGYCRVAQFIDKSGEHDAYCGVPVFAPKEARLRADTLLVVVPNYDYGAICENLKSLHPYIGDGNFMSLEDFLKQGRIPEDET